MVPARSVDGIAKTNYFIGATYLVSLLLTAVTTFLIAYRIYSSTKDISASKSKTRFNRILEILLQSAVLYTVSLLGYVVLSFVQQSSSNRQTLNRATLFAGTVLSITVVCFPLIFSPCINDTGNLEHWTYPHGCTGQSFSYR